jgi:hypothetical protein
MVVGSSTGRSPAPTSTPTTTKSRRCWAPNSIRSTNHRTTRCLRLSAGPTSGLGGCLLWVRNRALVRDLRLLWALQSIRRRYPCVLHAIARIVEVKDEPKGDQQSAPRSASRV